LRRGAATFFKPRVFKKDRAEVAAPRRVEQVVAKAVALATKLNADPVVVEKVYRAMISGFIEMELSAHERRKLGDKELRSTIPLPREAWRFDAPPSLKSQLPQCG
jgi:hypothetical protein